MPNLGIAQLAHITGGERVVIWKEREGMETAKTSCRTKEYTKVTRPDTTSTVG